MKKLLSIVFAAVLGVAMAADTYASEAQPIGVPAYSIASYEDGTVTYKNYGGVNEQSVFELASNGKVVAAYIALALVEEGKLGLDETVAAYLDARLLTDDSRMRDITLRQLLSHTAGFSPSFEFGVDKRLYADPGAAFRYSGVGMIYLQSVIENATGMTLEQAAEHYVFQPFGMANSTFEGTKTVTPHMRLSTVALYALLAFVLAFLAVLLIVFIVGKLTKFRFYTFRKGWILCVAVAGVANIAFLLAFLSKVVLVFVGFWLLLGIALWLTRKTKKMFYASLPVLVAVLLLAGFAIPAQIPVTGELLEKDANAAYTLQSTSEDMAFFCEALLAGYHGGDEIVQAMFAPAVEMDAVHSGGLGIGIETADGTPTYWHSGINPGFQSLFVIEPRQGKAIVILTSSDDGLLFAKDAASDFLGVEGTWDIPR